MECDRLTSGAGAAPPAAPSKKRAGDDDDDDEGDRLPPDPFLDDAADDEDEAWVRSQAGGSKVLDQQTDAVLSCPYCFTIVCYLCQQYVLGGGGQA